MLGVVYFHRETLFKVCNVIHHIIRDCGNSISSSLNVLSKALFLGRPTFDYTLNRSRFRSRIKNKNVRRAVVKKHFILFDRLPERKVRVKPRQPSESSRKRYASARGDCYESNCKRFLEMSLTNSNLKLVHGEVSGQGELSGKTFGHCWILDGAQVLDFSNGRDVKLPKLIYYSIGNVEWIGNFFEYNRDQVLEKTTKTGHWGPWDLKTLL